MWEFDQFIKGGNPSGHSVTQRFEFWKAAIGIASDNIFIGVGTGDMPHAYRDQYIAIKQMSHPGAMLSFELKDGLQAGIIFMNKLKMCVRTVSLGTCDTLVSHPASMTHYSVPKEEREKYGITDGLIRMNVGIENVQDIINDLAQAL